MKALVLICMSCVEGELSHVGKSVTCTECKGLYEMVTGVGGYGRLEANRPEFPFLCVGEIVDEIVGIALPHWTC